MHIMHVTNMITELEPVIYVYVSCKKVQTNPECLHGLYDIIVLRMG